MRTHGRKHACIHGHMHARAHAHTIHAHAQARRTHACTHTHTHAHTLSGADTQSQHTHAKVMPQSRGASAFTHHPAPCSHAFMEVTHTCCLTDVCRVRVMQLNCLARFRVKRLSWPWCGLYFRLHFVQAVSNLGSHRPVNVS